MSILEIVLVGAFALALILPAYFLRKLKPALNPKIQKIIAFSSGIILLAIVWTGAPEGSPYAKAGLTVVAVIAILNSLRDWLFKSKKVDLNTNR